MDLQLHGEETSSPRSAARVLNSMFWAGLVVRVIAIPLSLR
jgi:hypothetical protein